MRLIREVLFRAFVLNEWAVSPQGRGTFHSRRRQF